MSKIAEMKMDDGSWVEINIKNLTANDVHREFRCGWKSPDGKAVCYAPMTIAYRHNDETPWYFREAKTFAAKHLPECKRQRHQKNRSLSSYDQIGREHSKNEFLEQMLGSRTTKARKPQVEMSPTKIPENEIPPENVASMEDRPLTIKPKFPTTTLRMAKFLETLPLESPYMGEEVHNWIVDLRTIDDYREDGIPSDDYIFFLGTLVFPESVNIKRSAKEWILADCQYQKGDSPDDHLFVRMQLNDAAYERMKKFSHSNRKYRCFVVVCAKLTLEEGNTKIYTATAVNPKMIGFIPKTYVSNAS